MKRDGESDLRATSRASWAAGWFGTTALAAALKVARSVDEELPVVRHMIEAVVCNTISFPGEISRVTGMYFETIVKGKRRRDGN